MNTYNENYICTVMNSDMRLTEILTSFKVRETEDSCLLSLEFRQSDLLRLCPN